MDTERNGAFADVPTLKESAGIDWQMAAWRGLAGPAGMPEEATETLTVAFEKVWNSAEFQDFMKGRGFGLVWKPGSEFSDWMSSSDVFYCQSGTAATGVSGHSFITSNIANTAACTDTGYPHVLHCRFICYKQHRLQCQHHAGYGSACLPDGGKRIPGCTNHSRHCTRDTA